MRTVADHHGLPVIDTSIPIEALVNQARDAGKPRPFDTAFIDKMHPTALANRSTSQWVFNELSDAGWPEARLLGRADSEVNLDEVKADFWGKQSSEASQHTSPHMHLF